MDSSLLFLLTIINLIYGRKIYYPNDKSSRNESETILRYKRSENVEAFFKKLNSIRYEKTNQLMTRRVIYQDAQFDQIKNNNKWIMVGEDYRKINLDECKEPPGGKYKKQCLFYLANGIFMYRVIKNQSVYYFDCQTSVEGMLNSKIRNFMQKHVAEDDIKYHMTMLTDSNLRSYLISFGHQMINMNVEKFKVIKFNNILDENYVQYYQNVQNKYENIIIIRKIQDLLESLDRGETTSLVKEIISSNRDSIACHRKRIDLKITEEQCDNKFKDEGTVCILGKHKYKSSESLKLKTQYEIKKEWARRFGFTYLAHEAVKYYENLTHPRLTYCDITDHGALFDDFLSSREVVRSAFMIFIARDVSKWFHQGNCFYYQYCPKTYETLFNFVRHQFFVDYSKFSREPLTINHAFLLENRRLKAYLRELKNCGNPECYSGRIIDLSSHSNWRKCCQPKGFYNLLLFTDLQFAQETFLNWNSTSHLIDQMLGQRQEFFEVARNQIGCHSDEDIDECRTKFVKKPNLWCVIAMTKVKQDPGQAERLSNTNIDDFLYSGLTKVKFEFPRRKTERSKPIGLVTQIPKSTVSSSTEEIEHGNTHIYKRTEQTFTVDQSLQFTRESSESEQNQLANNTNGGGTTLFTELDTAPTALPEVKINSEGILTIKMSILLSIIIGLNSL